MKDLPLSRRQMVEIAKALALQPQAPDPRRGDLGPDRPPTSSVSQLLHELRRDGLALLYISHRMHEIEALADTCSVFRNGRHVETFPHGARSDRRSSRLMIGRDIAQVYPPKPVPRRAGAALLEVNGLGWGDRLADV